jgi:uncharacterized protein YhaN
MRIVEIQVQSYGALRNYKLSNLPPDGLIVIHGPNEAGKSTLLKFIHFILFGTHGHGQCNGSLSALFGESQHPWTISRQQNGKKSHVSITRPDSTVGTESDLINILQGTDDRLFRGVFAFGLEELQDFETLRHESIRERIFTAGLVGAARSPREVANELESQCNALLRQRGECPARAIVTRMQDLRAQLEVSRKSQSRYAELQTQVNTLASRQDDQVNQISVFRKKQSELKTLVEVWPIWEELQNAESALKRLQPPVSIPSNSEMQLTQLRTLLNNGEEELSRLRNRERDLQRKRDEIKLNPLIVTKQQSIEALHTRLAVVQERWNQIKKLETERKIEHDKYLDAVREIGSGITEERIVQTDVSFGEREKVREWVNKLEVATNQVARTRGERDNECRSIGAAELRLKELEQEQGSSNTATLAQQESEYNQLRAAMSKLARVVFETQSLNRDVVRLESELKQSGADSGILSSLPVILAVTSIALIGVAALQLSSNVLLALLLVIGAIVTVVVCIACAKGLKAMRTREESRRQGLDTQLGTARKECEVRTANANQLEEDIRKLASRFSIPVPVTEDALNQKDQELKARRDDMTRLEQRRGALERAQQELNSLQNREQVLSNTLAVQEASLRASEEAWQQWKQLRKLPSELKPQSVLDLLIFVARAQECVKKRSIIDPQLKQLKNDNLEWENAVRATCEQLNVGVSSASSLIEKCIELRALCLDSLASRGTLDAIIAELTGIERDIALRLEKGDKIARQVEDLLKSAGVKSDVEFHQLIGTEAQRQKLLQRRSDLQGQISGRIGAGQSAEKLRQMLITGECVEWRQRSDELDSEIARLESSRDQLLRDHTSANQQLDDLRRSVDIASRELEYGTNLTELSTIFREWRVLKLAHSLIERTMKDCEENRQPQILQEAQRWLTLITDGRYTRILRDEENQAIQVMNALKQNLTLEELSRGTAEQLYLSVRLGLVQEFSKQRERLPLIFDDILVNFDPKRSRRVAECLRDLACEHRQQILLFTCHPQTRDLMREVYPACRVEELSETN